MPFPIESINRSQTYNSVGNVPHCDRFLSKDKRLCRYFVLGCVIVLYPAVTPLTFQQCRSHSDNTPFTIDNCSPGQVIRILRAEVGLNTLISQCIQTDVKCRRPTCRAEIWDCSGQSVCSFSSNSVLRYWYPERLCRNYQRANFIRIEYQCINGSGIVLLSYTCVHLTVFSYCAI